MVADRACTFCNIVLRKEPATIRYENDAVLVFENRLRWAPVMLLVVPKQHMTQEEVWSNGTIAQLGAVAVELAARLCPRGFRILSNFGRDAMQSQEHGHIHILGGMHLGPYA